MKGTFNIQIKDDIMAIIIITAVCLMCAPITAVLPNVPSIYSSLNKLNIELTNITLIRFKIQSLRVYVFACSSTLRLLKQIL